MVTLETQGIMEQHLQNFKENHFQPVIPYPAKLPLIKYGVKIVRHARFQKVNFLPCFPLRKQLEVLFYQNEGLGHRREEDVVFRGEEEARRGSPGASCADSKPLTPEPAQTWAKWSEKEEPGGMEHTGLGSVGGDSVNWQSEVESMISL